MGRIGSKTDPFKIGEKVRTRYFRGAAPKRERVGTVVESRVVKHVYNSHIRYRVHWDDSPSKHEDSWLASRSLESIERGMWSDD